MGVAPETLTLPTVVNCPLCQQNTLHIFDDIATDGLWLHCNSCAAHGDIITFGAVIWNTSLPDALTRFADLDIISGRDLAQITSDCERLLSRRTAMEDFWRETSAQVWSHGDDIVACRLNELGVQAEINATGLVGVAHPEQIDRLCTTMIRQKPPKLRAHGPSIVFPFYDLPGRPTGILAVQYSENFESQSYFIPLSARYQRRPEAGYFLLHAAMLPPAAHLKGAQFIVDDPFWALNAQCQQLRRGLPLLPIMGSYTGKEANSYGVNWLSFPPTTRLFQSAVSTPELISRAATAKGYVSVLLPARTHNYKLADPTLTRLAAIRRHADTWQTCLHKTLAEMNEIAAQTFARKLYIPHEKLNLFFRRFEPQFSAGFADRVLSALRPPPGAPSRVQKRWALIERDNSWWNHLGQQVCSVRPVITKVIHSDNGEKFYAGTIYTADGNVEFIDTASKIEYMGLLSYTAALLAPTGRLVIFDRMWNKRSHTLALQLQAPELINISSKLGWDAITNVFRFGRYELTASGEVVPSVTLPQVKQRTDFPEPAAVAPPGIHQFLAPSYQNGFVWSVFSAVVANLVAPIVRQEQTAAGIVGPGFNVAARIGAALRCEQLAVSTLQRNHVARQVFDAATNLDWPLFAYNAFDDTTFSAAITRCHNRPIVARLAPFCAAVAPGYGWHVIASEPPPPATDFTALQHALPAYIQRALRNRMRLATTGRPLVRAILADVHQWLAETYGATFNLVYAQNQLITAAEAHEALLREINCAVQAGKIDILPRPRRKDQPYNYILRQKNHYWLNRKAIDRYFYTEKSVIPNWPGITDLLTTAGVFCGEEIINRMPGVLVAEKWCQQFWVDDIQPVREIG